MLGFGLGSGLSCYKYSHSEVELFFYLFVLYVRCAKFFAKQECLNLLNNNNNNNHGNKLPNNSNNSGLSNRLSSNSSGLNNLLNNLLNNNSGNNNNNGSNLNNIISNTKVFFFFFFSKKLFQAHCGQPTGGQPSQYGQSGQVQQFVQPQQPGVQKKKTLVIGLIDLSRTTVCTASSRRCCICSISTAAHESGRVCTR
jgi:hypothetical protein